MSISELWKGVLIGVASILPGVSGGTLAVSMGIYDRIILAVTDFFTEPLASIRALLPYVAGAAAGVVGFSFSAEYLFSHYPLQTSLAFMGLILGGVPMIWEKIHWENRQHRQTGWLISGLVFAVLVGATFLQHTGPSGAAVPETLTTPEQLAAPKAPAPPAAIFSPAPLWMLAVGIIAAATLVIPGISGSMLLMMLGVYQPLLSSINRVLRQALALNLPGILEECRILGPFGAGIFLGVYLCARLMKLLFQRYQSHTYCAILGLVLSSPIVILAEIPIEAYNLPGIITGGLLFLVGLLSAKYL